MITFRRFLQTFADIGRLRRWLPILITVAGITYGSSEIAHYVRTPYPRQYIVLRLLVVCLVCGMAIAFTLVSLQRLGQAQTEARQRLRAMEALQRVALDVASELDLGQVLQRIARCAATLTGAASGFVFEYDPSREVVRVVAEWSQERAIVDTEFSPEQGIAGEVLKAGRPVVVNSYHTWPRQISLDGRGIYGKAAGVPLQWRGKMIGTLTVANKPEHADFTDLDAWLLRPFADLASLAITNARMYGEIKVLNEELARRDASKTEQLSEARDALRDKAQQLQGLVSRMTSLQEAERSRIARDMHDGATQLILGAVYATQAASQAILADLDAARQHMSMVQQFLHQAENELRTTIWNLRPLALDDRGIIVALRQYVDRHRDVSGLDCSFEVTGRPVRLDPNAETAAFRIVQEALQNVVAHAQANCVTVGVHFVSDRVRVTVEDDGVGFDPSAHDHANVRFGVIGMRERAEGIGATLQLRSEPGEGTQLVLDMPVSPGADEGEL